MLLEPEITSLEHTPVVDSTPHTTGTYGTILPVIFVRHMHCLVALVVGFSAYLPRVTWCTPNPTRYDGC